MGSPHAPEKIPWHCLTDHITLHTKRPIMPANPRSFQFRPPSKLQARNKAFSHFARALAHHIVSYATGLRSRLPPTDASNEEWKLCDVIPDALFPPALFAESRQNYTTSMLNDPLPPGDKFLVEAGDAWRSPPSWEHVTYQDYLASDFIIYAVTRLPDQFAHVPSLIYLAQHPRVRLTALRGIKLVSYEWPTNPHGVDVFMKATLTQYILLNLLLALGLSDWLTDDTYLTELAVWKRTWHRPQYNIYPAHDGFHAEFWAFDEDKGAKTQRSPDAQVQYSQRCFRSLVALYAVFHEAVQRDKAVVTSGRILELDETSLAEMIRGAMEDIDSHVLKFDVSSPKQMIEIPAPELVDNFPPATKGKKRSIPKKSRSRKPSQLLRLPAELHLKIYAHAPPADIRPMVFVCRMLRNICTPLLYIDPMATGKLKTKEGRGDGRRIKVLCDLLQSRADLLRYVRVFHVIPDSHYEHRVEKAKKEGKSEYELLLPLELALSQAVERITSIRINFDSCDWPAGQCRCFGIPIECMTALHTRWPMIQKLDLGLEDVHHPEVDDPVEAAPVNPYLVPFEFTNKLIVNQLIFRTWRFTWPTLLSHYADSLQCLNLIGNIRDFDEIVFPSVVDLTLNVNGSGAPAIATFRTTFPVVIRLKLILMCYFDETEIPMDLEQAAPVLEELALTSRAVISHLTLPRTLKKFALCTSEVPATVVPVVPALERLLIRGEQMSLEYFSTVISKFPNCRTLEVDTRETVQEHVLSTAYNVVAKHTPKVESLTFPIQSLTYRPTRSDHTFDDGLDILQKQHAIMAFVKCPKLAEVSFENLDQKKNSNVLQVPPRVWVRDPVAGDEVDARMVAEHRDQTLKDYWDEGVGE